MDVAGIVYTIDPSPAEQGAKRAQSALDALERRTDQFVAKMQNLQKQVASALSFPGIKTGGGGGSVGGGSGTAQAAQSTSRLADAQRKAADEALKHAQALARLQQAQGNTSQGVRTLETALRGSTASMRQMLSAQTQLARLQSSQTFRRYAGTIREAGESIQQAGYFLTGLTTGLLAVGGAAVKSAFEIDRNVNVLKAFLGGTEAAEARLKQLIALSQNTPGLTVGLATTLDAQLRTAGATEKAINKVLPAIGKLNAVSKLQDPGRFAQNLIQLVTQNFERIDLKELIGQSPLGGQVIKDIFKVDSAIDGKAIRESAQKLGITTVDAFFEAFGKAAESNKNLANVTESLETKFAKLADRVSVALRPLGVAIIDAIAPLIERLVPVVERLSKVFSDLPKGVQQGIIVIGALVAALGPAVIAIGALIQSVGAITGLVNVFGALSGAATGAGAATAGAGAAMTAALGPVGVVLGVLAVAAAAFGVAWVTNFGGIRDVTAEAVRFIGQQFAQIAKFFKDNEGALDELRRAFRDFSDAATPIVREFWETFRDVSSSAFTSVLSLARDQLAQLTVLLRVAQAGMQSLRENLGITGGSLLRLGADSLNPLVGPGGGLVNFLRNRSTNARGSGEGLGGEEVTQADIANAAQRQRDAAVAAPRGAVKAGGGGGRGSRSRGESSARQERGAQEQLDKARVDAQFDLEERRVKNLLEIDKDAYDQRTISATNYYAAVEKRELELQDIARKRIEAEVRISSARLVAAKPGSPEALREQAELVRFAKELQIIEIERPNILRKTATELRKLNDEANEKKQLQLFQDTSERANRATAGLEAVRKIERDKPKTDLSRAETELQGLAARGLIREQQLTDGLTLARRKYREEIIRSLEEARKEADRKGEFDQAKQIEDEIASVRNLGAELTRAEQLQRRFAEQGVLDYSRLNEGVEDYLASQKGITEAFADFRTNQVADAFGLIEKGVDKLTERMGILGDAVGSLLKDLLKLAAASLFKKLFGIPSGGQQAAGGGGGGFSPLALLSGGSGGGGGGPLSFLTGGGQGGGSPFLTGGFAGGNPAGSILGGGGQSTGLGSIFSGRGSGGGLRGLLSKIPGIGRLFGGASGVTRTGNIGSLPGVTRFPVQLSAQPGALAGAGGLAAPGLGASLGAGGLLAGGGLLGSLAGGKSPTGRLLGGLGGTLLGGVAGASGFFGGGVAAALPAFFTNPITAVIGGALIGGALLARFLSGGAVRSLRKLVKSEYALDVKSDKTLESIKAIGEQKFGKKEFKKHQIETVKLAEVRELLAQYAERTGQKGNGKLFSSSRISDPFDAGNQFRVKRGHGGGVNAGGSYLIHDAGKPEIFMSGQAGNIFPSIENFAGQVARSMAERQAPQPAAFAPQGNGGEMDRMLSGVLISLTEVLGRLRAVSPGDLIQAGLAKNPAAAAKAVSLEVGRRSPESQEIWSRMNAPR